MLTTNRIAAPMRCARLGVPMQTPILLLPVVSQRFMAPYMVEQMKQHFVCWWKLVQEIRFLNLSKGSKPVREDSWVLDIAFIKPITQEQKLLKKLPIKYLRLLA